MLNKKRFSNLTLKDSEAILKTAIECFPFDVFIVNNNGYYTMQNSTCKQNWGDIVGKRPEDVANNKETFAIWKSNNSRAFSGETVTGEVSFQKNGGIYHFYNIISPIYINSEIQYIIGINIDITENKKTKQKFQESEEKHREIIENLDVGFFRVSLDGTILTHNRKYNEILGINPAKRLDGEKTFDFWLNQHDREKFLKVLKKNKKVKNYIASARKLNGEIIVLQGNAHVISDNNGLPIATEGTIIDITERKQTEAKVRESEEKYRHLYENSSNVILLVNMNGIIIDCNIASQKLSGFNRNELVGMNFAHSSFIPKEHLYSIIKDFKTLMKNEVLAPREIQLYTNEKKPAWVSYQASIFSIENEKVIQVIIEDISERKKAEENLKDSEAKYHNLFETSPDGVLLTNLQGTIIECNSAIELISGYSSRYFIGKNFMELKLYLEDGLEQLKKGYKDLFKDRLLDAVEFPIKTKDNKIKWVQLSSNLLNMKSKAYILVVIHEITSQKEAEKALKENEKKFRDILETSSVGLMELDVIKKKLLYINPKLLDIVGLNKEEITEDIFLHKIVHPNDLAKLLKANEDVELEFRITDKQGRLKWLSGKKIPHHNQSGEITSIRVWLDDITEKKMYENLIYELNINFLNFTADIRKNIDLLLNTCLLLLDGNHILYVHKNISKEKENYQIITSENKKYNFNSEEFTKLFISALFHEEHDFPQTFFDIDRMTYAKSDPFLMEHKFKGGFGKVIKSHEGFNSAVCIFYKKNPIISGQDKLVMFLICDALEIEQRRWQVQQDLEKQNITLNEINKLKSELFSRTSHELKTPLISVKGFTELLLTLYRSKLDPEIISILEEIKDGSRRLEKIINLLLDSTKLEAGQLSLNLKDEDLTFLIKFCVKELKGLAKLRDQSISLNLQNKLETKFDKERIYEVISNLLVNAIKYTPPGGHITIESKVNKNVYEFSIKDDGIGFTEEEKVQVFKQFGKIERYGQGWDIAADGTGLGLYITKKLVELHGGKIWFESEGRNKGTTFYFTVPIMK